MEKILQTEIKNVLQQRTEVKNNLFLH